MDILFRARELLSGKVSHKRKSTIDDVENIKKIRMSERNGDYHHDHLLNSVINSDISLMRNSSRRTESHLTNNSKSDIFSSFSYDQGPTLDQNGSDANDLKHFFGRNYSEFKQPMPPPFANGVRRVPGLLPSGRSLGSSFNQTQQTMVPHYSKFGEQSELAQFKRVPELYPIKSARPNASYSSFNGHDNSSAFSSTRYGSKLSVPKMSDESTQSVSDVLASGVPPKNLSRSRYQFLMELIPGYSYLKKSKKNAVTDASGTHGIIDLSDEPETNANQTGCSSASSVPNVERVNSLKARLETKEVFNDNWTKSVSEKYSLSRLSRRDSMKLVEKEAEECERKTRDAEDKLKESFNKITISSLAYEIEEEEEPANDYPKLEQQMQQKIVQWVSGRDTGTVLMNKFNLSITRHDIQTLQWNPITWLNDEVINFYMELLAERSRCNEKLPKVHGMNTFFLKRLLEAGYSGVRRWTRKVDIFAQDIIPVPVHKGIHWCMAIIHIKNKTIKYYDSMGAPNNAALNALMEYLKAESLDKKKVEMDTKDWTMENVRKIPQQENGSDCGVFSCMYAEFITRNRPIVFSQQHMQYFRMKMVYEICTGQMLN